MRKKTTEATNQTRNMWERLEEWVREKAQGFIQIFLVEDVTELLGRARSPSVRLLLDSLVAKRGYPAADSTSCRTPCARMPRRPRNACAAASR